MIEDELNVDSEEDEDLQGVPEDLRDVSKNLAKRTTSNNSQSGLLSQYISQKMAKQVVREYHD